MAYTDRFKQSDDDRREERVRRIERSLKTLTLQELESLYYDMSTKNYINEQ
jgi:N-glycosylase/DNA lyase